MKIVTWNVLHRIHAENWREDVLDRFPDEPDRIEAITRRVVALLVSDDTIVCLQEVSGDQRDSLRAALPSRQLWSFQYPRVPRPKGELRQPLRDPSEHLVTIAAAGTEGLAEATPSDPGKGFLVVDVDGISIVNTHVVFGDQRVAQLRRIAAVVGTGPAVVCGDFNASRQEVRAGLGGGFDVLAFATDALPTRPRRDLTKPPAIDHVALLGLNGGSPAVLAAPESDHNVVSVLLR